MGQIDENEDSLFTKHQELCRRLNLDANAAKDSWDAYERIKENYTLEVRFCFCFPSSILVSFFPSLSRDMVKYLSRIEESVLESLAWESKSPLWQEIESCEGGVPSYEDVALPGTFGGVNHNLPSQLAHRRNNDREAKSPLPSATERLFFKNTHIFK